MAVVQLVDAVLAVGAARVADLTQPGVAIGIGNGAGIIASGVSNGIQRAARENEEGEGAASNP